MITNTIAEVKLSYRPIEGVSLNPVIDSSRTAQEALFQCFDADTIAHHETFKVLLLNKSNKILGVQNVSEGGVDSTVVDTKIIMQAALLANASGVIVCHNHPSGNLTASQSDMLLTTKLQRAMEHFDIKLLDHIILSPDNRYYSFADEGILN